MQSTPKMRKIMIFVRKKKKMKQQQQHSKLQAAVIGIKIAYLNG